MLKVPVLMFKVPVLVLKVPILVFKAPIFARGSVVKIITRVSPYSQEVSRKGAKLAKRPRGFKELFDNSSKRNG